MSNVENIAAIANFLGSEMTEEQAKRLMDEARSSCSISDLEWLSSVIGGSAFYTELSMHEGEMGGYSRY